MFGAAAAPAWLAGMTLALLVNRALRWPRTVRAGADGSFVLRGSPWPLLLMWAIFRLRYAVAVTLVFHPALGTRSRDDGRRGVAVRRAVGTVRRAGLACAAIGTLAGLDSSGVTAAPIDCRTTDTIRSRWIRSTAFCCSWPRPTVFALSLLEAVVLSRRQRYDWRAFGASAFDLVARIAVSIVLPLSIATPFIGWAVSIGWRRSRSMARWRLRRSSSARSSATTGTTARRTACAGSGATTRCTIRPTNSTCRRPTASAVFGKLTGTPLFFVPLMWLGFSPRARAAGADVQPAVPVLAAHHLVPQARLARRRPQHAVGASRAPRREPRIPRCQLRRRADGVRSPVRHLSRRARRRARALWPGAAADELQPAEGRVQRVVAPGARPVARAQPARRVWGRCSCRRVGAPMPPAPLPPSCPRARLRRDHEPTPMPRPGAPHPGVGVCWFGCGTSCAWACRSA